MQIELNELKNNQKNITFNNCQFNLIAFGKEDLTVLTDDQKKQIL